jgi:SHS2 domain-containing protein
VKFLEEVLYQGSVENQWLVDVAIKIDHNSINAQVSWVDSEQVERELEVKAITLHELVLREIKTQEIVLGLEPNIPTFEGPGWMAQVVLDI